MAIIIHRFINNPIDSNCFVISNEYGKNCVIIDPGTEDCSNILPFLEAYGLEVEYCFLTHEHIDHIVGMKTLKEKTGCQVVCSSVCAGYLNDTKYNLSEFEERFVPTDSFPKADITFDNHLVIKWNGLDLKMSVMPGHSRGSAYLLVNNNLFVGDNLIKGIRTKANYFGGAKKDLLGSLETVLEQYGNTDLIIHCGHFDSCTMAEIKPEIEEQMVFLKKKTQNRYEYN